MNNYPGELKSLIDFSSSNGSLKFNENFLKDLLEDDLVKERKIVVVSFAGAVGKGNNNLFHCFLKYLYAKVSISFISLKKKIMTNYF